MKKIRKITLLLLLVASLVACTNKELNRLESDNIQLQEEIKKLTKENGDLENTTQILSNEKNELNKEIILLNEQKIDFKKQLERNQFYLIDTTFNFNPYTIEIGEKISGLEVSKITIERKYPYDRFFVNFSGEIKLKGILSFNEGGGSGSLYSFMVDEEDLKKVPQIIDFGKVFINISNDEEITRLFGEEIKKLSDTVHIEAIFDNYSNAYVPESDWPNFARFVKLINKYE